METVAAFLRQSRIAFALLSCVDSFFIVAGCAMFAAALFGLTPRKKPVFYVLCAAINIAFCIADPPLPLADDVEFWYSTVGMLLPFVSMALIFPPKGLWKAMLTAAGYVFAESLRFLILLGFFHFDYNQRDDASELIVGVVVDLIFFGLALYLLSRWARRHTVHINATRQGAVLYLLIVLSTAVFVTTVLVVGSTYSGGKGVEFGLMLLNVPVVTATVTYALVRFYRMRSEAENRKKQLEMQIRQFEWMEQMVEDVRMFRHDLPKKMRPLIAYLDEDRPDEAKRMAEEFAGFAAATGERFHTGNYRLDTVLFCEAQLAQQDGTALDVPFDTVFPAEGIDPDDIYTIFPNALDNAIEACRNVEGDRVIEFRSRMDKQTVFVTIRNPVAGTVRLRDGVPQSTKADQTKHGYGFRSIKKAAAKYGADNVSFTVENGVFELRIFLRYSH